MAKQYYWLQLKEDFFRQKEIKLLRKIAGGDTYTIIYLKMMLVGGLLFMMGRLTILPGRLVQLLVYQFIVKRKNFVHLLAHQLWN